MTGRTDTERALDAFLAPEPERLADRVIDATLAEVARTSQRPGLRLPWRFPAFATTPVASMFAAAALVAVIGAGAIAVSVWKLPGFGGLPTLGPSLAATEAPTPAPTGPMPLRKNDATGLLAPGTYVLDLFPTDLGFDIPDGGPPGWRVDDSSATYASIAWADPVDFSYSISFFLLETIHRDPCNELGGTEPVLGPSVDDLIATLAGQEEFQVSEAADVTIGAFQGKEIVIIGRDGEGTCAEMWAWAGAHKISLEPGEDRMLRILDVDGVTVVIQTWTAAEPIPAAAAELDQILDSFRMEYIDPRPSR